MTANTITYPIQINTRFGNPIKSYDDGFGPLWIMRDSMGIVGIVRAQTWEDAHEIFVDEILPRTTFAEMCADCDTTEAEIESNGGELPEGYSWTGSGEIAIHDLNDEYLHQLTPELISELGLQIIAIGEDD